MRQGDKETGRQGDKETGSPAGEGTREGARPTAGDRDPSATRSPCLPVSLSPCLDSKSPRLSSREPVGLLAGWGRFPVVFAEKAREVGIPVVCVGFRGLASPELRAISHRFYWTGVARLGRALRCFKREGVVRWVMAGKVHKSVVFT